MALEKKFGAKNSKQTRLYVGKQRTPRTRTRRHLKKILHARGRGGDERLGNSPLMYNKSITNMSFEPIKPRGIRITDGVWERLKQKKKASGFTWSRFIKELIDAYDQ